MASIERSLWRPLCLHSATTATLEPPWRWFCLHSAFFARPVVPLQQLWSFKEGTRVVLQQLHRNRTFWVQATTERPNHFYGRTRVARRSQPCVKGPLAITSSDNGLLPVQCQAIIWTNAHLLSGMHFSEMWNEIDIINFLIMYMKISSAKWKSFCLSLNLINMSLTYFCGWVYMPRTIYYLVNMRIMVRKTQQILQKIKIVFTLKILIWSKCQSAMERRDI